MTEAERGLQAAFRAWQRALERHEDARVGLNAAIRTAVRDGMSQSDVARLLGWPRQRVSEVLRDG